MRNPEERPRKQCAGASGKAVCTEKKRAFKSSPKAASLSKCLWSESITEGNTVKRNAFLLGTVDSTLKNKDLSPVSGSLWLWGP